jgi:transcriptional regulator with XRE-family HTH domain
MSHMPHMLYDETSSIEIGRRLLALLEALNWSQTDLVRVVHNGLTTAKLNNYIRGRHRLPVQYAAKISAVTGANIDYFYQGTLDRLPADLLAKLTTPEDEAPPRKRRRGRPTLSPRQA